MGIKTQSSDEQGWQKSEMQQHEFMLIILGFLPGDEEWQR